MPLKGKGEQFALVSVNTATRKPVWTTAVPQAITAPVVACGESVYFVSGSVLYRVHADSGVVCWKHTLPLNTGEVLTEFTFATGELRASGPGVLVRITERTPTPLPEPTPNSMTPPADIN
ncbi:MAG: hypothetical protein L0241_21315 [Planctomycetia bacterium]|nr:hypothetical protein [Planctomycetia bacterium]